MAEKDTNLTKKDFNLPYDWKPTDYYPEDNQKRSPSLLDSLLRNTNMMDKLGALSYLINSDVPKEYWDDILSGTKGSDNMDYANKGGDLLQYLLDASDQTDPEDSTWIITRVYYMLRKLLYDYLNERKEPFS